MAIDIKMKRIDDFNSEIDTNNTNNLLNMEFIRDTDVVFFQRVEQLISTLKGNWTYDTEQGIDYNKVRGRNVIGTQIEQEYVSKISAIEGFKNISNFVVDFGSNRNAKISFVVTSLSNNTENFETEV